MKQATILIIDDEPNILEVLSDILRYGEYNVKCVDNGKDGLHILKNEEIDLVLLDMIMPVFGGIEVLKEIMQINPEQPVIMVSGHGSVEKAVEATKSGAYDFLEKPLSSAGFINC